LATSLKGEPVLQITETGFFRITGALQLFSVACIGSLLTFLIIPPMSLAGTEEAVNYNNQGFELEKAGKYREAFEKFSQAIAEDPKIASTYANRGVCYEALGRADLGLKDFNTALRLDPKDTLALHNRGVYYLRANQFDKGIADLSKSLALGDPDPPSTYCARGMCYVGTKQYELALKDINLGLKMRPQIPAGYYARGLAYFRTKQYSNVFADMDYAIRYDSTVAKDANIVCAESAIALKQWDKALSYLNASIRLDPKNKDLFLRRAQVYAEKKEYKGAVDNLNEVLRLAPQLTAIYKNRAEMNLFVKDYEQSAKDCDKFLETSPGDQSIYRIGVLANCFLGKWQKSDEFSDKYFLSPDWSQSDCSRLLPISYVSYAASNKAEMGRKLVEDALAKVDQSKWPYPILQFLHHDIGRDQLIEKAADEEKMTDAQVFIALDDVLNGNGSLVEEKLKWLAEKGKKDQFSCELAFRELRPLQLMRSSAPGDATKEPPHN
jgi:tetratricopeptide (TPR) repeat protein